MISFKLLEQYLNNANINLIMSKSGDEITVSLLPLPKIKDDAKSNLKPIIIRGTAAELDEQFHVIIQKPLEKVSGIVSNIIEFEASAEKVAAESKINEKVEKDNSKITKIADKFLSEASALMVTREYKKAKLKVEGALKAYPTYDKALAKLEEIKKLDTPDIFNAIQNSEDSLVEKVVEETVKVIVDLVEEQKNIKSAVTELVILDSKEKESNSTESISIKEIAEASPNIIIATIPIGHEEAGMIYKEDIDALYAEPDNSAESPRWNENEDTFNNEKAEPIKPQQETINPDLETLF